jgi:hypothetical protein
LAQTLTKWGLTGLWSSDCDSFPSERNTYMQVRIAADGRAMMAYDSGKPGQDHEIVAAAIADDGSLTVRVRLLRQPKLHDNRYVKALPKVMRLVESREVGGDYAVRDGHFVATKEDTLWQMRCY